MKGRRTAVTGTARLHCVVIDYYIVDAIKKTLQFHNPFSHRICNRAGHYIFAVISIFLLLLSFFYPFFLA